MTYAELKLIEEAKDKLRKAFRSNAALRATKVELEKKLAAITKKLMEKKEVDEILDSPKYKGLSVLREKGFLADLEKEVAAEHAKAERRSKKRDKDGSKQTRTRQSVDEKKRMLLEIVKAHKGAAMTLADIGRALAAKGQNSPAQAWLKPLGLPDSATKPVSGSKRDGTHFYPKSVPWLKEHI